MLHHQVAQWCLVNVFFFWGGGLVQNHDPHKLHVKALISLFMKSFINVQSFSSWV